MVDGERGTNTAALPGRAVLPWLIRVALLVPPLAMLALAWPRLVTGLALEAAFPVTAYVGMNLAQPHRAYAATSVILSHASAQDGETQLLRSEAASLGREPPERIVPLAQAALARAPATARGWILLARLLAVRDPARGAAALTLAYQLAPREYYLIAPRAAAGAPLWDRLAPDVRVRLLADAQFLVTDSESHAALLRLLATPGGPALVTRTFAGRPDDLRAFNRKLARERLGL